MKTRGGAAFSGTRAWGEIPHERTITLMWCVRLGSPPMPYARQSRARPPRPACPSPPWNFVFFMVKRNNGERSQVAIVNSAQREGQAGAVTVRPRRFTSTRSGPFCVPTDGNDRSDAVRKAATIRSVAASNPLTSGMRSYHPPAP